MPLSAAASASGNVDLAAAPVQHSMPPSAAASASGDVDPTTTISAAQIGTQCTTKTRNSRPNSSGSPDYFSELKKVKTFHLEGEYEKQEDAPAATPVQHSMPLSAAASASGNADLATAPVQRSMPPSAVASASGDADPAATISAAQIGTQCTTKTRNSRPNSSGSPDYFSELKKVKTCNYSSKRQCGLLSLLDEYT
nr:hypothetical protein CFP56_56377 [Quercus suber]